MNRYKCPKCKGNQFTSNPNREKEPCIYCRNESTVLMPTLDEKPGEDETKLRKFLNAFKQSQRLKMVVAVQLPTGIELIINSDNLDKKADYYMNAYNSDLELKNNTSIKIVDYMFI